MTPTIQVGTVLIGEESAHITKTLALESDPYVGIWSVIRTLDGFSLDDKIRAAGWNFFFMAGEVKATFFGVAGAQKIQHALNRISEKVKAQNFNCLEVTGIVAKRFLGVPYTSVLAHSRHIQESCELGNAESRQNDRRNAEEKEKSDAGRVNDAPLLLPL
jgi:hypothetical protein